MTRTAVAADDDVFDVVVVGAGSAGCAAAGALAGRHGLRVALVEEGPVRERPAGPDTFVESTRPGFHRHTPVIVREGRRVDYVTGRGVGGGSAINAMIADEPDAEDLDVWRDIHGCRGWGGADVQPWLSRVAAVAGRRHSARHLGPVGIALGKASEATRALGVAEFAAMRASSDVGFLPTPLDGSRLSLIAGTRVDSVGLEQGRTGKHATGVALADGRLVPARAVVVSAGALVTPRLLASSGVVHPALGAGVMDHPGVMFSVAARRPSATRLPVAAGIRRADGQILAFERIDASGRWAGISVSLLDVESRGRSHLEGPVAADLALLSSAADVQRLVRWVRDALRLLRTMPMKLLGEFFCDDQGTRARSLTALNDAALAGWLCDNVRPLWHVAGGCAMGTDGPLDARCAVRGVEGLWVADASVMPRIVRANPNLTVTMIGDKVADHVAEALR